MSQIQIEHTNVLTQYSSERIRLSTLQIDLQSSCVYEVRLAEGGGGGGGGGKHLLPHAP